MEREQEEDPYEAIEFGDFATYFRHKKQKLQLQQDEIAALAAPDTAQIFEGIVAYVNGYTDPPVHEIRNMIVQRGGEFRQHLSKISITHIIASNLTQAKMKEFRNYKVAKPEWIVESVKANRLLSWHKFSTLRIPNSLAKFGDAPVGLQRIAAPPSGNVPECHDLIPATLRVPVNAHINHQVQPMLTTQPSPTSTKNGEEYWDVRKLDEHSVIIDTPERIESTAAVQRGRDDEDMFPDDLDMDELGLYLTPPNAVLEPVTASPLHNRRILEQVQSLADPPRINTTLAFNPYARVDMPPPVTTTADDEDIGTMESNTEGGTGSIVPGDERHPTLIELSVPWNRLNSSIQPGFVEKFYQSSRLHYLSTWKAKLRDVTAEIQKDRPPVSSDGKNRTIIDKPELQNKPIAVAHGSGGATSNSEIASCNYLAREFGVKNGMQLKSARALCPDIMVVPYEFQQYEDISIEFYKILLSYADELQAVSVDEAIVDVTSKCLPSWEYEDNHLHGDPSRQEGGTARMAPGTLAQRVRNEILLATGCHASVGIAPNILLAKLATKRAKPHGQYIWPSAPGSDQTLRELQGPVDLLLDMDVDPCSTPSSGEGGSQYLQKSGSPVVVKKSNSCKEFGVKDLPGVGYKITQDLQERFQVQTLYELQQLSKEDLQRVCGMKTGEMLYNSCRGIDSTTLASNREKSRQSVSAEISWGVRFENQEQVDVFLEDLAKEVCRRLKEIDRKGKSVVMKIMKRKEYVNGAWKHLGHGPVDQFNRTGQLPFYTDDPGIIGREARKLLLFFKFNVLDIRGLGIQIVKLDSDVVNTVSKSAFVPLPHDSMNQTTLTSAMFQQKSRGLPMSSPVNSCDVPVPERAIAAQAQSSERAGQMAGMQVGPENKPTMEIDRDTFSELPPDIQDELSRHHHIVLVNQDQNRASSSSRRADGQGDSGDASEHERHEQNVSAGVESTRGAQAPINQRGPLELPPWSQVDPAQLMALSTPVIRDTLKEYVGKRQMEPRRHAAIYANDPMDDGTLPSPSKLDQSVLEALPPEIRAEIEQEYTLNIRNQELIRKLAQPDAYQNNTVPGPSLPQPPAPIDHHPYQETSRGRGRPRGSARGRPRGSRGRDQVGAENVGGSAAYALDDVIESEGQQKGRQREMGIAKVNALEADPIPMLDADFLAALPPDIRAEVEAAHKVEVMKIRQKQHEAAWAGMAKNRAMTDYGGGRAGGGGNHGRPVGPPRPDRPTLMGLRDVDVLRNMLGEWVQSTLMQVDTKTLEQGHDDGLPIEKGLLARAESVWYDEGPNPEDVRSFSDFIARVIFMERDLERVRLLLRFLRRKIEESGRKAVAAELNPKHVRVLMTWPEALHQMMEIASRLVEQLYGGIFVLD